MKRWEYKLWPMHEVMDEPALNRLGQEGWELVSTTGFIVFKRPLHDGTGDLTVPSFESDFTLPSDGLG